MAIYREVKTGRRPGCGEEGRPRHHGLGGAYEVQKRRLGQVMD
jgi:hypothetical protein